MAPVDAFALTRRARASWSYIGGRSTFGLFEDAVILTRTNFPKFRDCTTFDELARLIQDEEEDGPDFRCSPGDIIVQAPDARALYQAIEDLEKQVEEWNAKPSGLPSVVDALNTAGAAHGQYSESIDLENEFWCLDTCESHLLRLERRINTSFSFTFSATWGFSGEELIVAHTCDWCDIRNFDSELISFEDTRSLIREGAFSCNYVFPVIRCVCDKLTVLHREYEWAKKDRLRLNLEGPPKSFESTASFFEAYGVSGSKVRLILDAGPQRSRPILDTETLIDLIPELIHAEYKAYHNDVSDKKVAGEGEKGSTWGGGG